MSYPAIARFFVPLLVATSTAGCGLLLDVDPPDPQLVDAAVSDLSVDATRIDGGPPRCVDNAECNDGDPCNGAEVCTARGCKPGRNLDCDDRVDCTRDTCVAPMGCMHEARDAQCDLVPGGVCDVGSGTCQYPTCTAATCVDGPCSDATCVGLRCVLTPRCTDAEECCGDACVVLGCSDDNPCTDDACVSAMSTCGHEHNLIPCDDGDPCTDNEFCASGTCSNTTPLRCDDLDPCTLDRCDRAMGGCAHPFAPDGTSCDNDTNLCTNDSCTAGTCVGSGILCADVDGNPCTAADCDPMTGECASNPVSVGTLCPLDLAYGRCNAAGACDNTLCPPALADCTGDGVCECLVSGGGCAAIGCRVLACTSGSCLAGETCCASTGVCGSSCP